MNRRYEINEPSHRLSEKRFVEIARHCPSSLKNVKTFNTNTVERLNETSGQISSFSLIEALDFPLFAETCLIEVYINMEWNNIYWNGTKSKASNRR